jgi:phosphatidylglycerophosphate synthase
MAATLSEVRRRCRRHNHEDNKKTMFFSSRVSVYITYLVARTSITADQVTYMFMVAGILAAGAMYMPLSWAPLLSFLLYRIHVVLDVVDGEVARFRGTSSSRGAYLDFMTHYFVYAVMAFGCGVNAFLMGGGASDLIMGFAAALGLVLNLASKDCWYRACFNKSGSVESGKPIWKSRGPTLLAARILGLNAFFFLYASAAFVDGSYETNSRRYVLATYAVLLPLFAVFRAFLTARFGAIPRRAAWYDK